MQARQTANIIVKFRESTPEGFKNGFNYPVYGIDVIDDDGTTNFLLSDNTGTFRWINMDKLQRYHQPQNDGVVRRP